MLLRTGSLALFTFAAVTLASEALAIGTTTCANADSSIRRVEEEVWGTNAVTWYYGNDVIPADRVNPTDNSVLVDLVINQHPDLGEERIETRVEKVNLTLADGAVVSDFVMCRSLDYPGVLD